MRILFLCSSLRAGWNGVGDYTRRLAGELAARGHQCAVLALHEKTCPDADDSAADELTRGIEKLPGLDAALSWQERSVRLRSLAGQFGPDVISLQYVPYGFHDKGLPVLLPRRLAAAGGPAAWHIMFHEVWTGITGRSPWSHKVSGMVQKRIARDLVRRLRPVAVHTSNPLYEELLRGAGITAELLPLFGNIRRDASQAAWMDETLRQLGITGANRASWLVAGMFGSCHPDYPLERQVRRMAAVAGGGGKRLAVLGIGGGLGTGPDWEQRICGAVPGAVVCHLGRQPESRVSAFLSALDTGMACTPAEFVGKSGSAAAMVLHGVALDNSHRGNMPEYRHLRLAELDPRSLFCEASEVARRMEEGIGARARAEMEDGRREKLKG
jgi:hypothetical protein